MSRGTAVPRNAREEYERSGWLAVADRLAPEALEKVRDSIAAISRTDRPEVVQEAGSDTVRALHGCHGYDDVCAQLVRHPLLLDLAEELVGDRVYVYQFKVNIKSPREGQQWPWHQDFAFWAHEDGMPAADAVNIAINLDEVHEHNGPLTVLTGSHRLGLIEAPEAARAVTGRDWHEHVSARLTHTVPDARVRELAADFPPVRMTGPAGAITAFHPSIVHSSTDNLSDDRRAVLLITYNSVRNAPVRPSRPDFLVGRDTTPVERLVGALA
ncbi:phytanoyl-CoA dioxygenase [Streptomyces albus subsp. albus]|nr:phytanoyl-CoA dioxygenase [Streptomyces albus subsp. albus]